MALTPVIKLTQQLIRIDSTTPDDKGCQKIIADLLRQVGFHIEHKSFGLVDNLFAWHGDKDGKSLMFLGHTDVVPVGDKSKWKHPPFAAFIEDEHLYGRGAADMKSGVTAFTLAMIDFVKKHPNHAGKISLMLTSDEEGVAEEGVKKMMPHISKSHDFDYCIVGEPSSSQQLGDVVRIGRRGSLHVEITIHGKQGHVAYPQNASNPVFLAAKSIDGLSAHQWDEGNHDFPATSFQISSVKTSSNTANIIPADLVINGNFRYSPESSQKSLSKQLDTLLTEHNLNHTITWKLSGNPFHSKDQQLKSVISKSIHSITHIKPQFNTAGGTSDGRFVAPFGVNVVELGVINKTIHQIDECVAIKDIENLEKIYHKIISSVIQ